MVTTNLNDGSWHDWTSSDDADESHMCYWCMTSEDEVNVPMLAKTSSFMTNLGSVNKSSFTQSNGAVALAEPPSILYRDPLFLFKRNKTNKIAFTK